LFIENTVKEGVVDVELVDRLATHRSQCEHHEHHGYLDDRMVCFTIVDVGSLCEATDHPSCLVTVKAAVLLELVVEHPFAMDNDVCIRRPRDVLPGHVAMECIEL
jgi:hypothetical protein